MHPGHQSAEGLAHHRRGHLQALIDYGFPAPAVSFPAPGTIMVDQTESEHLAELGRFYEATESTTDEMALVAEGH